jgi:predicted DNA-binding protein
MYNGDMRTTIELKPEHRARLLELAARRGEKGFSSVIAEAVDSYLADQEERRKIREQALRLRGTLAEKDAEELRANVRRVRERWR